MSDPDPDNEDSKVTDRSVTEAKRYLRMTAERPEDVREERGRIIGLLSAEKSADRNDLERRAAASGALAKLARAHPASLKGFLPVLVEELRRETDRGITDGDPEDRVTSRTIRNRLVRTVAHVIVGTPETTVEREAFVDFVGAVTTDLDGGTLRVASRSLFAAADERPGELASVAERLGELLAYPDAVVQAWAAGTVGRVAAERPDAVAATADDLRRLLAHDDETVQHNALEALATLVGPRPDTVAPAADALRDLLAHEEAAIQHNAAGVLGRLAEDHPDAVIPAVEDLRDLRDHDDEAVRRIATGALLRLARRHPDAVADR